MKVFLLAFFVLAFFAAAGSVDAQSTRTTNSVGRRLDDFSRQGDRAARDEMNREMRTRKPTKEELQNAARIKAETKEDLEGLQDSYNEIVVRLKARDTPSTFVVEAASKVNKHALRLKLNVAFPKLDDEGETKPLEPSGDTRRALLDLCTHIYDLLMNPIIENPQVLDLPSSIKARNAVDSIITLSGELSKQ